MRRASATARNRNRGTAFPRPARGSCRGGPARDERHHRGGIGADAEEGRGDREDGERSARQMMPTPAEIRMPLRPESFPTHRLMVSRGSSTVTSAAIRQPASTFGSMRDEQAGIGPDDFEESRRPVAPDRLGRGATTIAIRIAVGQSNGAALAAHGRRLGLHQPRRPEASRASAVIARNPPPRAPPPAPPRSRRPRSHWAARDNRAHCACRCRRSDRSGYAATAPPPLSASGAARGFGRERTSAISKAEVGQYHRLAHGRAAGQRRGSRSR